MPAAVLRDDGRHRGRMDALAAALLAFIAGVTVASIACWAFRERITGWRR